MSTVQDWSSQSLPEGDHEGIAVEIEIDVDDELMEITGDMLLALSEEEEEEEEEDDPDDEVTEVLPELSSEEVDHDWPRSWEAHLHDLRRLTRNEDAAETLAAFGLGDVRGCEKTAAAIACAWENLRFWEPMIELGTHGDFTGHIADLRRCEELLETHQAPIHRADMLERWEQARAALRRALPAERSSNLQAELLQRFSQQGRGKTQVTVTELRS